MLKSILFIIDYRHFYRWLLNRMCYAVSWHLSMLEAISKLHNRMNMPLGILNTNWHGGIRCADDNAITYECKQTWTYRSDTFIWRETAIKIHHSLCATRDKKKNLSSRIRNSVWLWICVRTSYVYEQKWYVCL